MQVKIPITITAVAVFKTSYLTAESVQLEIVDGVVVSVKPLTRAPDMFATAIAQCTPVLWDTSKTNPPYKAPNEEPKPAKPNPKKG